MVLLIDNYDSFTYNIYQYLIILGYECIVKRNNEISISDIEKMEPSHIIISPGPGSPITAGISVDVIKHFAGKKPILGICLGHQCIGYAFNGEIVRANSLYHGKTSVVTHDGEGIFKGIKSPFTQARYHSLVIRKKSLPACLEVSAHSADGVIMGVRHKEHNIHGVQFHPESVASDDGLKVFENFLTGSSGSSEVCIGMYISKLVEGTSLSQSEAEIVINSITEGNATPAQTASILTAMKMKGETVDEITGFVNVMRQKAIAIQKPQGIKVMDTCGTGGDKSGSFNISTASALISAGANLTVAKHGNRSVTSKCGSADVLEALGVKTDVDVLTVEKSLNEAGIAFLFAPLLHKSMKHAVVVRREIAIRTIFNILGPLANPARAEFQVIGCFDRVYAEKMAIVLSRLGVERAMVVHGIDGLDEITLTGKTAVYEVKNEWVKSYTLTPDDFGLKSCTLEDIKGGDSKTNAKIIMDILCGKKGPHRDIAVANSAAAIFTAGKAESLKEAVRIAQNSIDSSLALKKLEMLKDITNNR